MLDKKPFKIYQRTLKSGKKIFYVKYLKPDGTYTAGRSTGEYSSRKAEAVAWKQVQNSNATGIDRKMKDFSKGFFDWNGEWALSKRSGGRRLSKDQCEKNEQLLRNHVVRLLGDRYLSEFDTRVVRTFRNTMYSEGYSGSQINKALGVLRALLEYADELYLLRGMPRIERAGLNQKEKGILTANEVRELFSLEWPDDVTFTANLVAAATGFRMSEVLGLRQRNVLDTHLEVTGAWVKGTYREGTKNGQKSRKVPIPQSVQAEVQNLIETNPFGKDPERFLFFSYTSKEKPIQDKIVSEAFYSMMKKLGINRKERNISFHSHRHFFNSLLVESRVPIQKIQQLTGHLSIEMTARYYHTDTMEDVAEIQNRAFTLVKGA
ncbi:MAG: site-specific integrase [Spirochaetaceae bacterium]|nr:site-specific integrase [Spirochaetia bacterium]MCF7951875.1 site-specific integrase [Spirochaetaceae bacterium]